MTLPPSPASAARVTLPAESSRVARRLARFPVTPARAIPLALVVWALAFLGDALTSAEATFTLLYLLPVSIAAWYRSNAFAAAIACLCTLSSVVADVSPQRTPAFLALNNGAELVLFLLYGRVLGALRLRIAHEMALRGASVAALRHAERLGTVGRLASGVAHELGTPLNVISGRAELIREGSESEEAVQEGLEIIIGQVHKMAVIIRGLLDFARRDSRPMGSCRVSDLAERAVSVLRPLAKKAGVEVHVGASELRAVVASTEVEQIFTNLLINAIQAMGDGGRVDVEIRAESHVPPTGGLAVERPYVVARVRDRGPGIPDDVRPRIFDPFFTTKDVGRGTGLGLWIAQGIAEDHDGWISVESVKGQGTTFSLVLPRA